MRCSICKEKKAIIHIQEYSNNGVKKLNLCIDCALKKGLNLSGVDLENIFYNLIKNVFNNDNGNNVIDYGFNIAAACPACKMDVQKIVNELKVGCPTCYSVYEQIIDIYLFRKNNSITYCGKLPGDLKLITKQKNQLSKLKSELRHMVNLEDYKKAAVLRDQIKSLKKNIQRSVRKIGNK